jgi:hypothetical protein
MNFEVAVPEVGRTRVSNILCYYLATVENITTRLRGSLLCTAMLSGSLKPRHTASSDCEWKRMPPEIEGKCE